MFTVISSFGSGVWPSMQSLALCIQQAEVLDDDQTKDTRSDVAPAKTGSVIGALSVIQASGQMILGVSLTSLSSLLS
jgi:hypothetical protein